MLGKRKRDVAVARRQNESSLEQGQTISPDGSDNDQDVFRRYFESTFEPLPESEKVKPSSHDSDEEENEVSDEIESDWEGLSEDGANVTAIQVVEHKTAPTTSDRREDERQQYKSFMTSKPPKGAEQASRKMPRAHKAEGEDEEEEQSEALNLKHDLDLQRLLKESHLLEKAKSSADPGSHRHKAIDMRMQTLGSKDSLFHQQRMPASHRRGIVAKAASKEAMRRKDAKENGIILEKAAGKTKSASRRDRAVDVPAVGKFRGGTLQLSKRDLLDIQGPGSRRRKAGR
ncbi:hypothetical protein B0A52_08266 [Exophiala mesophila]|uniref:Uncharacterized protein n=1 Tax=Exophiala mesophila TaxID=212818 RepID=A0A438MYU5_EXOME|nr:hypothetical protein B0A52_08266 [Exophiala mesophila]